MRRRTVGRFKSALGFITRLLVTWKFCVRPRGQGAAELLERDRSLSRCAFRFERNLADGVGALPHACGGSAPRGWIEPQWLGGRRSQGHQTVERREQLTCRGARLLQLGLAASSTRSVCPSSGLPGDASPALRPLEIDFCLRAIDSVSIDLWSRPIRERPAGRDLTGG